MSKNTKFVLQVIVSLIVFGLTWVVSNQAAVTTALAIVIAWVINLLATTYKVHLGRATITGILYVLSFGLIIVINPDIVPAWPALAGLPATEFIRALAAWGRELTIILLPYTGAAMSIYNVLLRDVLDQLTFTPTVSAETIG